jgi:AcrR family transcriptional regulator
MESDDKGVLRRADRLNMLIVMETKPLAGTLNKHELKTRQTRELLLRAAETVFVRDGYERAELGEIATMAGRTKGAIYAHFKSKEEIFLALFDERAISRRAQVEKALASSNSTEENRRLFREEALRILEDKNWLMLALEFKLFIIRHPESRERLQEHYDRFLPPNQEKRLAGLIGAVKPSSDAVSRTAAVQVFSSVFSALVVEASLSPGLLNKQVLKKTAERIFDALFPVA